MQVQSGSCNRFLYAFTQESLRILLNEHMQHLSSIPSLKIQRSRGGRISSQQHRKARDYSEDFAGLEENVSRYDLLLLVKRTGKAAGFSPRMIALLDYYMAFTREIDWKEGSRPIVYQCLAKTALDFGVSERQIQNLERQLFDAGAITWNDSGNHKRNGQRHPETGAIIYAYGVELTPLAGLKAELEDRLHKKQLYDQAWMETKRQISWYRAQIRAVISEVQNATEEEREVLSPEEVAQHQASYEEIAIPIRTYMDLQSLRNLLAKHHALYQSLENTIKVLAEEVTTDSNDTKMFYKTSCRGETNCAHYKYTTQKQSNKLDTSSSFTNICFQESVGQPTESQARSEDVEISSGPERENADSGNPNTEESRKGQKEGQGDDLILLTGLQHITLKQVLNAASSRFRERLPLEERPMNWNDVIEAAYALKSELYVSQKSWGEACNLLTRTGAAICLLLTDQAVQREQDPVRKPGAYFNAMIARARAGELRLHNSIFGLLQVEYLDAAE